MPIICAFENMDYQEINIPAWRDNPSGFDLHRQIFPSLVENQMMKISEQDSKWVLDHIMDLASFVDYARGDDTPAAGEMTVKLWDCQPKKGQQVVVLAHDATNGWTDLAPNCGDKTVTVTVPDGMDSFVVCLAY